VAWTTSSCTPDFLPSPLGLEQREWPPEQLLAMTTAQNAPGERWSDSNANYAELGLVLEKATGQRLADLIEHWITRSLGMKYTYLSTDAGWRAGRGDEIAAEGGAVDDGRAEAGCRCTS
jgi:D-alanyl-D-alanine carboxypeptidase